MRSKVKMFVVSVLIFSSAAAVSAAPRAAASPVVDKFAAVKEALCLAEGSARGGAESAKSGSDAPFQALQGASFTKMERSLVAGCPSGTTFVCDLICTAFDSNLRCLKWERVNCGCR